MERCEDSKIKTLWFCALQKKRVLEKAKANNNDNSKKLNGKRFFRLPEPPASCVKAELVSLVLLAFVHFLIM